MKKNILFVILLMSVASMARANDGKVILQSKGTVRFFDSSRVSDAIAAAVDGDTIDLASGNYYQSGFTIDKNILLRGRSADNYGEMPYTQVSGGNVIIISPCTLEGIYFSDVEVKKSAPGLRITSCSINNLNFSEDMPGMTVERSQIRYELCLNNLTSKDINFNNCKIHCFYGGSEQSYPCTFRNCNIANVYSYDENKLYTRVDNMINCIIESYYDYLYGLEGGLWINNEINCLRHVDDFDKSFLSMGRYSFIEGDTKVEMLFSDPYEAVCSYSKDELIEKGYLGTDGTVVGADGGAYPFTLTPLNTQISSKSITLDEATKKVTADVEVNVK